LEIQTNSIEAQNFSTWLLQIGNGQIPHTAGMADSTIQIPDTYIFKQNTMLQFIDSIYTDISTPTFNIQDKAILTPTNLVVDEINTICIDKMSGIKMSFISADSVQTDNDEETLLYPVEYLNSIEIPGMPPHNLIIKNGCPVILLRNINPSLGLCNGTRLTVIDITNRILHVKIMNGSHIGQDCYLPRIDICTNENALPMILKRRQFPVKLAFALTINKSQGQSFKHLGVYLPKPVFGHGQLYVAASRSGIPENTKFFITDIESTQGLIDGKYYTRNVVYKEVLN
jgi:hypothetical protein